MLLLSLISALHAEILSSKYINILDIKTLKYKELSDLAYKDKKLYIVANNGKLYTFSFTIQNKKIAQLKEIEEFLLKNKKSKPLKKKRRDAEGLCFLNENLLISFERKHRVDLYSLNGVKIESIKINKALENLKSYKGKNRGLEAVTYSKKYGIITAPETPFKLKNRHLLYAKKRSWQLKAKGDIKALEFINRDELLVLLRQNSGLIGKKKSSLIRINLSTCKTSSCAVEPLLHVDGNFEGLTKVYGNYYLMVSDSENSLFQKTQLVLFELKGDS